MGSLIYPGSEDSSEEQFFPCPQRFIASSWVRAYSTSCPFYRKKCRGKYHATSEIYDTLGKTIATYVPDKQLVRKW